MDARRIARLLVAGRSVFGVGLTLFPEQAAVRTARRRRRQADAAKLLRLLGIRDLVLASGLHAALSGRGSVRAWALVGVAGDTLDLAGTLALRDELEPDVFWGTVAAAGGGIVAGVLASRAQS
jgi:hypothetical protein